MLKVENFLRCSNIVENIFPSTFGPLTLNFKPRPLYLNTDLLCAKDSLSKYPVDTGRKLNAITRSSERLLNVLRTFDLRPVSTEY